MRFTETDLKALMLCGLAGDAAAQRMLLKTLAPMLRAFFARRLGSADDAIEDMVQDCLMAIHTRRATYDPERPFTAWVYAIARHKMIDHFRKRKLDLPLDDFEDVLTTGSFEAASGAQMDITRLLGALPAKQAEAIRATRIDGLSVAEAADRAGISESDVKVSVHRGLKALAKRLGLGGHGGVTTESTDTLIDSLVMDSRPVSRHAVETRLALGLLAGGLVTMLLVLFWLGPRPDLADAMMHGSTIWMKWGYTLSIGLLAWIAVTRLARPERRSLRWLWLMLVPIGMVAAIAVAEMRLMPVSDWRELWMGHSWRECSMRVLILSVPIFAGFLWAFRAFAPTRLRLAGAMAGLAAGGCSATLYGFACGETSALFVLTWYSLGIAAPMTIGALMGPRVLRW